MTRVVAPFCYIAAVVLLLAGIFTAWIGPRLDSSLPLVVAIRTPATTAVKDPLMFLGADLTTLGVIIAILIGYNVAAFEVAAQTLTLGLVRAILSTLVPILLVWLAATSVALIYVLDSPPFAGNLWQAGLWFGSTALLLVGYLATLPNKLSGAYAAHWALGQLDGVPIAKWESNDGYTVLQSGLGTAVGRADVGTVQTLSVPLGRFLTGHVDPEAERMPGYVRPRAYALRNLFAGCAPYRASAPGAVSYNLGFALAGTLLQGAAIGHPFLHPNGGLFSSLVPTGPNVADRTSALWSGIRHALCRREEQGDPFLRRYWVERMSWSADDERLTTIVAQGLISLHTACWQELNSAAAAFGAASNTAASQAVDLLGEVYRYLVQYLADEAKRDRRAKRGAWVKDLTGRLLDAIHEQARASWPPSEAAALARLESIYQEDWNRLNAI